MSSTRYEKQNILKIGSMKNLGNLKSTVHVLSGYKIKCIGVSKGQKLTHLGI